MDLLVKCLLTLGLIQSPNDFDISQYSHEQIKKLNQINNHLQTIPIKKWDYLN